MRRFPSHAATLCAAALLCASILACGDEHEPPSAPSRIVASTFTDDGGLDEAIDPADSHMVVDITMTGTDSIISDEPIENPVTGVLGTAQAVPLAAEQLRMHSGFSPSGQSVTTTYYAQDSDTTLREPEDIVRTRIVNDVATDYTAANVPVLETPEETAEGPDP